MLNFVESHGEQEGKDDLDEVGQDEGHDADHQRVDESASHHIDEPSASAEIDKSEGEPRDEIMRKARQPEEGKHEIQERHRRKRHDEAARRGEEHREAAAEPRENGKPDRPHQKIQPDRDRAALASQILEGEENAEYLQREGHGRRDRDEGADRVDRDRERDIRHIAGLQFLEGVFSHNVIILSSRPAALQVIWAKNAGARVLSFCRRKRRLSPAKEFLLFNRELNAQSACKTFSPVLQ